MFQGGMFQADWRPRRNPAFALAVVEPPGRGFHRHDGDTVFILHACVPDACRAGPG